MTYNVFSGTLNPTQSVSFTFASVEVLRWACPYVRVLTLPGKCWFFSKIYRTWKVPENEFGPRKSWKLMFEVLESPGIFTCGSD